MSPRECHDILRPVLEWAANSVSCMHGGFHAIFLFSYFFHFVRASTGEAWKFVEKKKGWQVCLLRSFLLSME